MSFSSIHRSVVKSRWIWAQILSDLKNGLTDDEVLEKYNSDGYGFNHQDFASLKKQQQEQDDYISNPPEVEEGVVECNSCGSKKVYSVSIQTRASDEPMSTKAYCTICRNRWTQNC